MPRSVRSKTHASAAKRSVMPMRGHDDYPADMLSVGQVTAVRGAFSLAGYDGDLHTLPITSEEERIFVLPQGDVLALRKLRTLEQVLQQVLGRKVWIVDSINENTVPFA